MKIAFLVGENPYQSTTHFAKKLGEALERLGVAVRIFDISGGCFYQAFYAILQDPPDLTCSFSDITVGEGTPLGEHWGIPHLSFFIDPAIYFLHQLKGDFSLATCVDEEDHVFLKEHFPRVCFLPHGVEKTLEMQGKKRIYEAAMLATCIDYEKVRASWKKKFSSSLIAILENAAERVLSPEGISSLKALLEAGVEKDLCALHHELDRYVCGKDRVELARTLSGTPLHIWGRGPWKKYMPDAILHRPISFIESLNVMQKTKLLLNSSPRFKHGSHERMFYGFASGCVVVTGDNPYVKKHFTDGESIVTYQHGKWKEGSAKILDILSHEQKRGAIVTQGREIVLHHHTWDHRAQTLIDFLSSKL